MTATPKFLETSEWKAFCESEEKFYRHSQQICDLARSSELVTEVAFKQSAAYVALQQEQRRAFTALNDALLTLLRTQDVLIRLSDLAKSIVCT